MEYVIIAIVVVVLAIAAVVGYVVPRRRRGVQRTAEAPSLERLESAPADTEAPAETAAAEAPAAPAVETPEPTAGRLVRLRSRLSRSQSTLGKGLLALLSRDRLD